MSAIDADVDAQPANPAEAERLRVRWKAIDMRATRLRGKTAAHGQRVLALLREVQHEMREMEAAKTEMSQAYSDAQVLVEYASRFAGVNITEGGLDQLSAVVDAVQKDVFIAEKRIRRLAEDPTGRAELP